MEASSFYEVVFHCSLCAPRYLIEFAVSVLSVLDFQSFKMVMYDIRVFFLGGCPEINYCMLFLLSSHHVWLLKYRNCVMLLIREIWLKMGMACVLMVVLKSRRM